MPEQRPSVTLYCGRAVSSWSEDWRAECFERHSECLRLEAMIDREARRTRLDAYGVEVRRRAAAAGLPDPDAVAAEAVSRVRELVLSRWRARNAASATA